MRRVPRRITGEQKVIHTDGSFSPQNKRGGWAWAHGPAGRRGSGAAANTTNQRMELQAALEAIRANPGRVLIVSDSAYVVNCFKDKWYVKWLKQNWTGVKNRDIWEPLITEVLHRRNVSFRWVKGHSGDAMNDLVDRIAKEARCAAS